MINDTFKMIVLIQLHIFTKKQILTDEKKSPHKWSQIKIGGHEKRDSQRW